MSFFRLSGSRRAVGLADTEGVSQLAGVHGLRGVQQPSAAGGGAGGVDAHAVDFDYDASSVTDASSSKATSRRNSEATTEASVSGSQIDLRLAQQTTAGLDNVIEGKAVE